LDDPLAYRSGGLTRCRRELSGSRARHGDSEVEAIEQRPGELLPIGGEPLRRASALDSRIAPPAAGAHVHRADQLKACREECVPAYPGHGDDTVLQWLAQRLQHGARELRKLVEEQHAAVSKGDFAGTRARPAAHDGGR
jgi:hypothetical protein